MRYSKMPLMGSYQILIMANTPNGKQLDIDDRRGDKK